MCFCLGTWCVLDSIISAEKKSCSVEIGVTMVKLSVLLKMCSLPEMLRFSEFYSRGQTQSTLEKLGILVKICLFSWDTEVFLCGIRLLTGKMIAFFFIFNELPNRYLQWPGKSSVRLNNQISRKLHLFWIYLLHQKHLNSLANEPFLISAKMTFRKKQSHVRTTFLPRTDQPMSTIMVKMRPVKKEHLY